MNLSYKYRIYPTESQAKALQSQLDFCRFLYNSALEQRKLAFKAGRAKEASFALQCKQIAGITKSEEFQEASSVRSSNLQAVLRRLDRSFQNFFSRLKRGDKPGFPRFRSQHSNTESMLFPISNFGIGKGETGGIKLLKKSTNTTSNKNRKIKIFGIDNSVLIKYHREIEGKPKNVNLKRQGNKWYVIVCCEDAPNLRKQFQKNKLGLILVSMFTPSIPMASDMHPPNHGRQLRKRLLI